MGHAPAGVACNDANVSKSRPERLACVFDLAP
jgi:hypothetical protein